MPTSPPTRRTREFLAPTHHVETLPPHSPVHSTRSNGVFETEIRRDTLPRRYSTTEAVVDARAFWPVTMSHHRRADSYPVHHNVQQFDPEWHVPDADRAYYPGSATAVESDFHNPLEEEIGAVDDVRLLDCEWSTSEAKQKYGAATGPTTVMESDPCRPSESVHVAADESFDIDDILIHYQNESSQQSPSSPRESPHSPTIGYTTCFACQKNIPETESFAKHLYEHAEQREEEERDKDVLLIDFSDDS